MFGLSAAVRVYLAKQPADMRKSFDGLAALASGSLALDPLSGHLFVFVNKRRDRIKILYWDRDGMAVWAKRLERGTFRLPAPADDRVEMTTAEPRETAKTVPSAEDTAWFHSCAGRRAGVQVERPAGRTTWRPALLPAQAGPGRFKAEETER